MQIRSLTIGLFLAVAAAQAAADHRVYTLYTFHSPPYQYANETPNGPEVGGETADTIRCAMEQAGAHTQIRLVPQNRALYSLKRNLVDGYFAVDRSPELDQSAWASHPVALEKWHWFYTGEQPVPENARIGVVGGSNEELWLRQQGLEAFVAVGSASQLPALLKRKRIDLALLDERVMSGLREKQPELHQGIQHTFLRYAPLHLYLNPQFVTRHPDFMNRFNLSLPACMGTQTQLSGEEHQQVTRIAGELARSLASEVDLQRALHQGSHYNTFTDILTQDTVWQALAPASMTPLARQILELPASRALAHWQSKQAPLVTEILLIDSQGALSAMSQLSSDYWQGDEAKFQDLVEETSQGLTRRQDFWVSPIRYDASTSRFQVIVSFPLPLDEPNNGVEGVLSIGLAIEEALKGASD
ncbi:MULTISPECIES: substrate-binding periplasmic protein [unclassified Marinobacter]|uniref:substrate-binding periplasmic protein n=1 Tax=unclassified Marinobacter TaxID=83889 RepID=UPI0018F1B300|nr:MULTISPECIES: transporter substrate-binding domain-containing protein [unclassified Marinobacter]